MNHKPGCSINIRCAVYHSDGICNHPKWGKCDCIPDTPIKEDKGKRCRCDCAKVGFRISDNQGNVCQCVCHATKEDKCCEKCSCTCIDGSMLALQNPHCKNKYCPCHTPTSNDKEETTTITVDDLNRFIPTKEEIREWNKTQKAPEGTLSGVQDFTKSIPQEGDTSNHQTKDSGEKKCTCMDYEDDYKNGHAFGCDFAVTHSKDWKVKLQTIAKDVFLVKSVPRQMRDAFATYIYKLIPFIAKEIANAREEGRNEIHALGDKIWSEKIEQGRTETLSKIKGLIESMKYQKESSHVRIAFNLALTDILSKIESEW